MRRHRRAKIVANVGPASASPAMLKTLFLAGLAGVDTFRLNFSHGTHADRARVHAAIRDLEAEVRIPIGILQDLQGPKIRVGTIRDGKIVVAAGEKIRFLPKGAEGDALSIPLHLPKIFAAVVPGHDLLIDDGRVRVRVARVSDDGPSGTRGLRFMQIKTQSPPFAAAACADGCRGGDCEKGDCREQ